MLAHLLLGLTLGFSAAVQPGPFVTYLAGQSVRLGWRRALPAIFAPLISDGPIITAVLLLLTRFPPAFLRVVQLVGGFFVLFLAWRAFTAWRDFRPAAAVPGAARQSVLQAALTNLLSPGPYIFWSLTCGPLLVSAWREAPEHGLVFVGGFYTAMLTALAGLVFLFSAAGRMGPRINRLLLGLSALALLGFGFYNLMVGFGFL